MADVREEADSFGTVEVAADKLWGAHTQRSLQHFSIGRDLMPREMITAYAIVKRSAAIANHESGQLDAAAFDLIVKVCDEILSGWHDDMFPLHVWMTGSGTQFNMNVNEVIANRASQIAGHALGSKTPVHPHDHVNMSQSSNDTFPSAMHIAAAISVHSRLIPAATRVTEKMFIVAAKAVAERVTKESLAKGLIYPPQSRIFEASLHVAGRVAAYIFDQGLARVARPDEIDAHIHASVYPPVYATED